MSTKNKISEKEAKDIVKKCYSIADFCREVGWEPRGANYRVFHKYEKEYNLDTSHFVQKSIQSNGGVRERKSAEEYAKGKLPRSSTLLKKLTQEGIKEWRCECCGNSEWLGDKIPLELHHIDGNHFNNSFDNLMLLCPNCHAKTDTYKGKKIKREYKCVVCGCDITKWAKNGLCTQCTHDRQRKVKWPTKEELENLLHENSFLGVSKMYGVSDHTIRKWCRRYGLPEKSSDYK